ncbi:MAG TPA: M48 family metalloprotease [Terracidiphilus sp.]
MATTAPPLICPQGHGPGVPGSRFCTFCGTVLVAASVPAQPLPATPIATAPPAPGGWQPINAGQVTAAPQWQSSPATAVQPPIATQWQPTPGAPVRPLPPGAIPAAAQVAPAPTAPISANQSPPCKVCRNTGSGLGESVMVCPECSWLRPLFPGYTLDRSVFLWAQDGQAMNKLQSISALHSAVKSVSDKVGRPWIESTFNGIRLGPRQFPDVWIRAVLAARILGLPKMPDVYISGDSQWNTYTYGTDTSAFIVLGTAILNNFQNDDLLFVLAREMGHCRAGHALWKTVSRFLVGDTSTHGILSNGVLNAISLSPTKWLQDAVDLPLMAWARQADVTADRAGLLAIGDEALARRVLLAWSIRSARLLKQVNIEEWMKQEDASDDQMTRFSEMTTSSSMYTTRRLRMLGQAGRETELMRRSQTIQPIRKQLSPPPQSAILPGMGGPAAGVRRPVAVQRPASAPGSAPTASASAPLPQSDSVRVLCNKCQTAMRIPLAVLRGKASLNVRCPKCQNIFTLRPKPASQATASGTNATTPPASPSTPAKPRAASAPQSKPSGAALPASKPPAVPSPSIAKTKSPARPSVATAPHKHAR